MRERHVLEILLILRTNFFMNVIFHHRLVVSIQDTLRKGGGEGPSWKIRERRTIAVQVLPMYGTYVLGGGGEKEDGKKSLFRCASICCLLAKCLLGHIRLSHIPKKHILVSLKKDEIKMPWKALTYVVRRRRPILIWGIVACPHVLNFHSSFPPPQIVITNSTACCNLEDVRENNNSL